MARLTNKQRDELFKTWLTGKYSGKELALKYNVSETLVSVIVKKKLKKKRSL